MASLPLQDPVSGGGYFQIITSLGESFRNVLEKGGYKSKFILVQKIMWNLHLFFFFITEPFESHLYNFAEKQENGRPGDKKMLGIPERLKLS